ncbi:hypothetical protein SNE40_023042 [Patella caerulea]|uniref:G-protein coupled receptors family 1 profile domain-containing protein n=1 Tax=Patella caerulea TaxID=87958 RepID=A0AAN8G5H0_PATCE
MDTTPPFSNITSGVGGMMENNTYDMTGSMMNTTMAQLVTTYKSKPILYLSEDESLNEFIEFRAAWALDTIYAPICSALGILGNTMSFLVLMLSKSTTTYQYMATISCTDTLVLILNILFLVRKFPGHEIFFEGTCKLIMFLFFFAIHFNVIIMVTMTLERYLVIKFPLKASGWFSVRKARIIILIELLIVFLLDMHNFFTRQMVPTEDGTETQCSSEGEMNQYFLSKVYPWIDAVWYCYLPLSCLCILNILIITQVKKSGKKQRRMTQTDRASNANKADSSARERQITTMLLLVTFCFLLFVSPMAVITVVEKYMWVRETPHESAVYHLVRTVFNNMMYTNHALNFLLYFMSGKRFRDQFMALLCSCRNKRGPLTSAVSQLTVTSQAGSTMSVAVVSENVVGGTSKNAVER